MEPEPSDQHDTDASEEHEDTSHPEQQLLASFRTSHFNVDNVHLDIDNAQALRTVLGLILSTRGENDHERMIHNFLLYFSSYLEKKSDDFDLSFGLALAFQEFIPFVYNKRTVEVLVKVSKMFLTSEEGLVKEEGLKMIGILLENMDEIDVERHLVEFIYQIYENEWWRCTGIDLIAIAYSKVSETEKYKFRKIFQDLMHDDSTLAKAAMARNYYKVVPYYDRELIEHDCIDMLDHMVEDIQSTVRLQAVQTAITLATLLDEDLVDKHICQIFEKLVTDQNWKVRQEVAILIVDIQKAVRPKLARILLINILHTLCHDLEVVVRKQLAQNIVRVLIEFKATSNINLDNIFKIINELNKDSNDEVKNTLIGVVMDCTPVLTPSECKTYLLPLIKNTLMCQRIAGVQKIKEQSVHNVNKLIQVLGYPALQEDIEKFMFDILSSESKWRTRRKLVMTLHILALNSDQTYFTKMCLSFYKKLLNDPCHAIRRIVPMILPVLIGKYGFDWGRGDILNWIFNFHDHPAYFQRLIVLYSIHELVEPSLLHLGKRTSRDFLSTEQDKTYLYMVYSTNELLMFKLQQLEVNDTIEDPGGIRSDLEFYGEDLAEEFEDFEIPTIDVLDLLKFIIKHVLPILPNYLNDKVINVVNRSLRTYRTIVKFHQKLSNEFQQEAFKEVVQSFTKESRQSIESNILIELTEVDGHMEKKVVHNIRGKEFETGVKFEDAMDTLDEVYKDINEKLNFSLSSLTIMNTLEGRVLKDGEDRDDCLDNNRNFMDADVDVDVMNNSGTVSANKEAAEAEEKREEGGAAGDSKGERRGIETGDGNDINDNVVGKHLLDDVDMKLFDDKKTTVLEFYSDSNSSDAIDV